MLVTACTVWLSSFQRYSRDVIGAPLHMYVRRRFAVSWRCVLGVFGRSRAAVRRCVSNASGAWVVMVLLGVAGVFETRHPLCDKEHNRTLGGV